MSVNKVCIVNLYLLFETDKVRCILYAIDLRKQFQPERLAVPLLISSAFPTLCEFSGSDSYLFLCLHYPNNVQCEIIANAFC